MTPPRFFLKCLGYPELRGADGKIVRIRVKKHVALLVFLAVERRRHHDRSRLVSLLWPRVSAEKGRHSISVAISLLRTTFGRDAFPPHRVGLRFHPAHLSLDLDRLESGRILGQDGEDDLDVDGFLRGFDIDDAPEFGLWKEREQARRLPSIHAGLLTLIDHGRRRGSHDEIMQRAERLLAIDHLAEEGIRAKMEALALVGDRFSALRVFEEWKTQLTNELGAEPSMMVEGMASQLRKRGWEPKEPNPVPAVPAEQWRDRRFVGRKQEFRRLYEVWEAVHQYRPEHFMIAGDSGVGKTTLAQRLVTAAGLEGASVSRVQCYQMEQRIPFGTIGALVAGLLGRPGVAATSPEGLAEVARIVPQVKEHFGSLPAPKQAEGESARLLFAEGVIDLLKAVMEERPVLLVIDDLHHADEASLAVLHLVMRRIVEGRLMVLAITTPSSRHRAAWKGSASPEGSVLSRELHLPPMDRHDTRDLANAILVERNAQPPLATLFTLCEVSAGFPLALEFCIRDWQERGSSSVAVAFRSLCIPLAQGTEPHNRYTILIDNLLVSLSEHGRRVAGLASLLGARLGLADWYSIIGLTVAQVFTGMSELIELRLLRDTGTGIEFVNDFVRAHTYGHIPAPLRKDLHHSIADRLIVEADAAHCGIELAWHLARAGRAAEAVPHLLSGALEARRRGAPDEAILALESALSLMDTPTADTARLLTSTLYQELGRWNESVAVLQGVVADCGEEGAERRMLQVWADWNQVRRNQADHRIVSEMLSIARSGQTCSATALMLTSRMALEIQSQEHAEEVLVVAPSVPIKGPDAALAASIALGTSHFQLGNRLHSARFALEGLDLAGPDRADAAVARLLNGLGAVRAASGDYDTAIVEWERALRIAERLENDDLIAQVLCNRAVALLRLRRYKDACGCAERALTRFGERGAPSYLLRCIEVCGLCHALLGNREGAMEWIRRGDQICCQSDVMLAQKEYHLGKADILWALDRRRAALDLAEVHSDGREDRHSAGQQIRWRVRVGFAQGQREQILEQLARPRAVDALDQVEIVGATAEFERELLGMVTANTAQALATACGNLQPSTVLHLKDMGTLQGDALPVPRHVEGPEPALRASRKLD